MRGSETSLIRAIRGPITLITLGVLFALNNFTDYRFHQTWPVLLIVFGFLSLVRRGIEPAPPAPGPGYAPPPYTQPYPPPPPPPPPSQPPSAAGGFRQSAYNEPSSKGGFGATSSAQRPSDPGENPGGAA